MEGHGVVGDRTTEKFRCGESGIPRCASEGQPGDRAFIGAGKRRNGRGAKEGRKVDRKQNGKAQIVYCREARKPRVMSSPNSCSYAPNRQATDVDRLWRQSGSHEPARQTSFTAMRVPRVHLPRTGPPTGEPDAGDPHVRFGGRGRPGGLSLPLSRFYRLCVQSPLTPTSPGGSIRTNLRVHLCSGSNARGVAAAAAMGG